MRSYILMAVEQDLSFLGLPDTDLTKDAPSDQCFFPIDVSVPERTFSPGEKIKWQHRLTEEGIYAINIIHRDYPDTLCQMQCTYNGGRGLHILAEQFSLTQNYIPKYLAEGALDLIWDEIERRTPQSA